MGAPERRGFLAALPTTDGTFGSLAAVAGLFPNNTTNGDVTMGSVTLTVSAVPEPNSATLMSPILLALALVARRRIARGFNPATRTNH
jgi:hypothetical protein